MSNAFVPTHEIFSNSDKFQVQLEDGALYTREEWNSASGADWELVDGELRFQGQIRDGYGIRSADEVRMTTRSVMRSTTGDYLGLATVALAEASDSAGPEGHVAAHRVDDDTWDIATEGELDYVCVYVEAE